MTLVVIAGIVFILSGTVFLVLISLDEVSLMDLYIDTHKISLKRKHKIVYFITSFVRFISGIWCGVSVVCVLLITIANIANGSFLEILALISAQAADKIHIFPSALCFVIVGRSCCGILVLLEIAIWRLLEYIEVRSGIVFK